MKFAAELEDNDPYLNNVRCEYVSPMANKRPFNENRLLRKVSFWLPHSMSLASNVNKDLNVGESFWGTFKHSLTPFDPPPSSPLLDTLNLIIVSYGNLLHHMQNTAVYKVRRNVFHNRSCLHEYRRLDPPKVVRSLCNRNKQGEKRHQRPTWIPGLLPSYSSPVLPYTSGTPVSKY